MEIERSTALDFDNKWPDQEGRYWWKLTCQDGREINDFYWKKEPLFDLGLDSRIDNSDMSGYSFTVHHAPSGTEIRYFKVVTFPAYYSLCLMSSLHGTIDNPDAGAEKGKIYIDQDTRVYKVLGQNREVYQGKLPDNINLNHLSLNPNHPDPLGLNPLSLKEQVLSYTSKQGHTSSIDYDSYYLSIGYFQYGPIKAWMEEKTRNYVARVEQGKNYFTSTRVNSSPRIESEGESSYSLLSVNENTRGAEIRADMQKKTAIPSSATVHGFYGFWQRHKQSIILGVGAAATVGLAAVVLQAVPEEGNEPELIELHK